MSSTFTDDEISYGPKKFGPKAAMATLWFVLLGVGMICWGMYDQSQGMGYHTFKLIFAGGIVVLAVVAGAIYRLIGARTNYPHVTMTADGVSYALSVKATFEIGWDSVGEFEFVYDRAGNIKSIQAPIIGSRTSHNLNNENKFSIPFLKLLDVDPTTLMDELNQVRVVALEKRKESDH